MGLLLMVRDQAGMSNPPSFLVPSRAARSNSSNIFFHRGPKQSASSGVTPRKCTLAHKETEEGAQKQEILNEKIARQEFFFV